MKLYHASNIEVRTPDLAHSRDYLDFGRGFYLTSIREQAVRYAERFIRRKQQGWINTYELSKDFNRWNILRLDAYNKEWLDFVSKCRAGLDSSNYDMVVGGIANDRVIITLDRYFLGEISQEQAIGLLRFEKPNIQYCIRSEEMLLSCLTFIKSERL